MNPVAVAIDSTVVDAIVLVSAMLPEPNAIALALELLELKVPVLRVNPARSIVPKVSANRLPGAKVNASASVTVMPVPLTDVLLPRVLPLLVMVADARNDGTAEV